MTCTINFLPCTHTNQDLVDRDLSDVKREHDLKHNTDNIEHPHEVYITNVMKVIMEANVCARTSLVCGELFLPLCIVLINNYDMATSPATNGIVHTLECPFVVAPICTPAYTSDTWYLLHLYLVPSTNLSGGGCLAHS